MSDTHEPKRPEDRRRSAFAAVTGAVYWFMVTEIAFLLAAAPGFVGILLLVRDPRNIPLYALCLVPLAPAFSAAVATLRKRGDDLTVWPVFWRAWRGNLRDVLWVWVPALAVAAVLATTIAFGATAGIDGFFIGVAIVMLAIIAIVAWNGVLIATSYSFRARDTARLAVYYLGAKPLVTLGILSFYVLLGAVVFAATEVAAAALAVMFAVFASTIAAPMIADIGARFVEGAAPGQ